MQQHRSITIDANTWEKTQCEIFKLRQQNAELKLRIKHLERTESDSFNHTNLMRFSTRPSLAQLPHLDDHQAHQLKVEKFKSQMLQAQKLINRETDFFHTHLKTQNLKLFSSLDDQPKQKPGEGEGNESTIMNEREQTQEEAGTSQEPTNISEVINEPKQPADDKMMLVESICLFGPSEEEIRENISKRRMFLPNYMIYSSNNVESQNFRIYGQYFYPQGQVAAKTLREEQAITQVNQIIFRKNTKKQDCSLFLFRGDENNQKLKQPHDMLDRINPGRWLSAFFVQFSDYEYLLVDEVCQSNEDKNNRSMSEYQKDTENDLDDAKQGRQSERLRRGQKKTAHYVKGKYTLCIFTYFPIVNLMQSLLSAILDEIKIKRVQKFSSQSSPKDVCIKFFLQELTQIGSSVYEDIQKIPSNYPGEIGINFTNVKIVFNAKQDKFNGLFYGGWVYDIAKSFEKDLIYELYTNMMTEESICFVCENMHLLTYVIFFFVCILTQPFAYPYPCISNVCNYELLESPFVVVAGINQSSEWLQENIGYYPKKIFVDLNDENKIKSKRKPRSIKSEKLRKLFSALYKKVESGHSPVPQIFKKKDNIVRPASSSQNQAAITFLKSLRLYYEEQLFVFLPNPAIIAHLRDKIQQKNQSEKCFSILKQIEKYLRESRKHKQKDNFIDLLVQQQIFYVFMGARYKLD